MDVVVRYVARALIEQESNKNAADLLNLFSKHDVDVLADLVKGDCRIKALQRRFKAFIYLCREIGSLPVKPFVPERLRGKGKLCS